MGDGEFQVNDRGQLDLRLPGPAPARRATEPASGTPSPRVAAAPGEACSEEDFALHGFTPHYPDPSGAGQDDYLLDSVPEPPSEDWQAPDPADDDVALWLAGLPEDVREEYLNGPWTGEGELEAAGFLHHVPGPSGRGFAADGRWTRWSRGRSSPR